MASKLTSGDIAEITNQSDLLSKPVRDNYTNLKNKVNEVIDDLAAVSIGTTNAETTAARPNNTSLKERLDTIDSGKPNYRSTITSLVTESTPNAMTVDVATGQGQTNGITVKWGGSTSGTITAPSVNPRIDIVVINSDNTLSIVTGAEAATPVVPTVASTQLPLARIDLTVGMTTITNSDIINYNGYVWSQIGEIISLHPDTKSAYLPNLFHYSPCDGVELLDSNYIDTGNDTNVPNLTDDRFLMGDTTYATGGSNTKNIQHNHSHSHTVNSHSHTVNSHNHSHSHTVNSHSHTHNHKWLINNGAGVTDQTYDSSGNALNWAIGGGPGGIGMFGGTKDGSSNIIVASGGFGYTENDSTTASPGTDTDSTNTAPGTDGQTPGTDTDATNGGSTTQDILPKYFSVLYYMRIR
jgi:hypothetical protein